MKIELSDEDFDLLLLALGCATGVMAGMDKKLFERFVQLANAINRNNPDWIPYERRIAI